MSSFDYSAKRKGKIGWESDKELRQYRTKQAIRRQTGKEVREFFEQMNKAYTEMKETVIWETELAERALFENTVSDGLDRSV